MRSLKKTDPELLDILSESSSANRRTKAFITTKDNLDSLRSLGFQPQMSFGNIALLEVDLEEIKTIAELVDVIRIEMPHSHTFMLDDSTKDIGANQIRINSGDSWSGLATGKGVITALIDSGINYEHRSFRNADGSTRILGILDFSLDGSAPHPDGGTRPNITVNFGIPPQPVLINEGVEYSRNNIRDALAPGGRKLRHVDTNGHGTHVAAIAAGNGFQRDRCGGFYPGVAPEADILVIKLGPNNLEPQILMGIAYAIHIATREGKALVINLSSSRDVGGAHDGLANLERSIDFMLDNHESNKNVSLVAIAGNTANLDTHAAGNVPPTETVTLSFQVSNNPQLKLIDIWYPGAGNNRLACKVRGPFPIEETQELLPQPTDDRVTTNFFVGGRIEIGSSLQSINNFQRISIIIVPPTHQGFATEIVAKQWKLDLRNVAATGQPIQFHAWSFFLEGQRPTIKFKSNLSRDSTVGIPGTARNVITVGSFEVGNGLSGFSGRGPTLDNRRKPDITAPGEDITAADSDFPGCCRRFWCPCCNIFHNDKDGTSEAAPHVTGAIALMLELNGGLTKEQVRDFIVNNARRDADTGPNPSNLWGAGKLNVAAAVNAVNNALPNPRPLVPGGPAPGGPPPADQLLMSSPNWMDLRDRFMSSPGGRFYYSLAEKYVDELRSLINENKKVATIWHRNDGPLMLRLGLRALAKPDSPLPRKVNDVSVRERLVRIAQIIRRFATASLAADLDVHLPVVFQMEGKSINQILSFLESQELVSTDAQ